MAHTAPDNHHVRLSRVLAGLRYPARTWQLIAQANYYGADWYSRAELSGLPAAEYPSLTAVLAAVDRERAAHASGTTHRHTG